MSAWTGCSARPARGRPDNRNIAKQRGFGYHRRNAGMAGGGHLQQTAKTREDAVQALILSNTGFGHGSLYPFLHYQADLQSRFGLTSTEIISDSLQRKLTDARAFRGELIVISVPWDTDRHKLADFYRELRASCPAQKLVHFDYADGNQSPHFGILPWVDLYLKQYLNTDWADYRQRFLGGSKFIEYLVHTGMAEDSILSEVWTDLFQSELPAAHEHKLMLGWNFGLWKRMIYLAEGKQNIVLLG
ncbi:MAG: hypothetical protein V2I74_08125, partial [Erythrobacter sp.]|nr:hypothetical protein [Erythrobacter sp.]